MSWSNPTREERLNELIAEEAEAGINIYEDEPWSEKMTKEEWKRYIKEGVALQMKNCKDNRDLRFAGAEECSRMIDDFINGGHLDDYIGGGPFKRVTVSEMSTREETDDGGFEYVKRVKVKGLGPYIQGVSQGTPRVFLEKSMEYHDMIKKMKGTEGYRLVGMLMDKDSNQWIWWRMRNKKLIDGVGGAEAIENWTYCMTKKDDRENDDRKVAKNE